MHILVTRPEAQAQSMADALIAMGHRVTIAPLLAIELETPAIDPAGAQALVLTSRNAVRALTRHPQRDELGALPVVTVGTATANAAREAGLKVVLMGDSDGAALAQRIAASLDPRLGDLVHLSGEAIAFDLAAALAPHGIRVRRVVVYRSVPVAELPATVAADIAAGRLDAVILMSPRTAQTWIACVNAASLAGQARQIINICLSDAVATPVRAFGSTQVRVAGQPNSEEILALVGQLSSTSDR